MATHEAIVRDWLKSLGLLCAGTGSVKDAQAKAAAYVPMLAREFRTEAFTVASLAAVARACKFFPSFGELTTALSAWWEDNAPTANVPLIAGTHQDEWRQRVEREKAEAKADWQQPDVVRHAIRSLDGHPKRAELGRMLAALINRHAPENLGLLPPAFLVALEETP
jgi:hypothetical protein